MLALVIVARDAIGLGDLLILDRGLEHHPLAELIDHRPLDFLPRRLAGGVVETALRGEFDPALGQFLFRDQDIGLALVEIDAHAIARL